MAEYFFLLDAVVMENTIRPAFAESWQRRSFEPCRSLCESLLPVAHAYAQRYHTGGDEPLLARVAAGLAFDRHIWRALVGETLLFSAVEIPEFQVCAETLCCLLAANEYRDQVHKRPLFAPIQQAHLGTRDLTFGGAIYRPEYAGYNNVADVKRLTAYLENIEPRIWTIDDLAGLRVAEEDERTEELELAREWFPALVEMYRRAESRGNAIVHESIY